MRQTQRLSKEIEKQEITNKKEVDTQKKHQRTTLEWITKLK